MYYALITSMRHSNLIIKKRFPPPFTSWKMVKIKIFIAFLNNYLIQMRGLLIPSQSDLIIILINIPIMYC